MEILVILIKLTGIFILEAVLIIILKVASYKMKLPSINLVCEPDVSDNIKVFLSECSKRLEKLNFSFLHYINSEGLISGINSENWAIVLLNEARNTFAVVRIKNFTYDSTPYTTEFITYLADNTSILTLNDSEHFLIGSLPDTIVNDPYALTLEQQWYSHLNLINKIKNKITPIIPSDNTMISRENKRFKKYFDLLIENNIKQSKNNLYKFRFIPLIAYSFKILTSLSKHILFQRKKSHLPKEFICIPNELIIENYKAFSSKQKSGIGFANRGTEWIFFCLTIFACILFSINYIFIGLTIILLFEFGYYLESLLFEDKN